MKAIFDRRSTRNFKKCKVSDETIEYLLKTAMSSPNSGHQEPWEFIVLRTDEIKTEMNAVHGYDAMLNDVDAAIVVCINKERIQWDGYWQMDTGTAVENMMIAATDMGLSTLWLELFPVEEKMAKAKKILNLPDHVVPMMVMPIGDTDEKEDRAPRYVEKYVHWDRW